VPATIGLLQGQITVGLTPAEMAYLDEAKKRPQMQPAGLAHCAGQERRWATVAGTMIVAHLAGIRVFATGGIGGVHRGHPFDVSADLLELAQTPVAVVCAGAKAILDLPLTLEVLETHGVPVVGYQCANFPAFYTRDSGLPLDVRCDRPEDVAAILRARETLGFNTGTLIATPVPAEHELPAEVAEKAIAQALEEAEERDVRGKYVTPFLLARVSELTHEESRTANVALLQNNARVAALIAGALAAS
jgi:pseudouridine-5'-phosphate glycosidase